MPFVGEIFAQLKAAAEHHGAAGDSRRANHGVTGDEFLALVQQGAHISRLERAEQGRPMRAARSEQHSLDCDGSGGHGRGPDRRSAVLPAGSGGTRRDDEGQHRPRWSAAAIRRCAEESSRTGRLRPRNLFLTRSSLEPRELRLDRPQVREEDPVTIIYTSGTSGEAKGVVLTAANVGFMLGCTSARLDLLMGGRTGQDRIFHYLPFSFCASWIAVLTFMLRGSPVTLNTDLTKIPNDMPAVAPHYFLNVPQLLERMRRGVDEQIAKKGGVAQAIYSRAKAAWFALEAGAADVPGIGWRTPRISGHPKEDVRKQYKGVDLRIGSAYAGNAGLFQDAGNSRACRCTD